MLLRNTFRAFRHRDYFIFWCGLFLGHTGTLVQATAQSWLIFPLTNSPFYLGLEGLCLGLPRVIFSPLGGAIVDRTDRDLAADQSAETNRGRMMSLFGLINRGLGPMGSCPFGLVATGIGAPRTVAICGFVTVVMITYMTFLRSLA